MKNILLYTDTTQIGGAELQMFLLAKFLDKTNFTPILACGSNPSLDRWCENFEKEDIKVIRIAAIHKHNPKHYFVLKKIIKNEKIDLIHAHVWNPASCRYAFLAANSTNTPILTTEHDPFKISFIKDLFKKSTLKKVKAIITVSENNKKILQKLYPKCKNKIQVIHNGIDTTWWHSQLLRITEQDIKDVKEELFQAKENTFILITVAELHERKGLKYLIEAMPKIITKYPNVKCVIIGEGSERNALTKLIKSLNIENHVILLGKQKEIPKLLKCSNIFVLPSRREAFGMVLLEAMVTGLPVIATKVGGIPEIIENGENGLLVEPENPAKLSKTIIDLISHPNKLEKLSKTGYTTVSEKFTAKKMAEQYEKIYAKT